MSSPRVTSLLKFIVKQKWYFFK